MLSNAKIARHVATRGLIPIGSRNVFILALFASYSVLAQKVPDTVRYEREISYRSGGGAEWRLDYAAPKNAAGPLPAVVVIHGGGWIEGDKSSYDQLIVDWADLGFFATAINYRLATPTHSAFPEALDDCRCAVRWLRSNADLYHVDKRRIGAYGSSAGGHLALLLAIGDASIGSDSTATEPFGSVSSAVCAVVSDSGVVSLDAALPGNDVLAAAFSQFLGGSPPSRARIQQASPLSYVSKAAQMPPTLMIYGTGDTQVPIKITQTYIDALRANHHRDLTFTRYEGTGHCPFFNQSAKGAREQVEAFLLRAIKNTGD